MEKKGLSYPSRDGVVGTIFTIIVSVAATGFIFWMALDAARHFAQGK